MFENRSTSDYYGKNDLILVSRTNSNWNWSPSNFNNNNDQTARFFDFSDSTWDNLGTVTYSSHGDNTWQESAFSFTLNNIQNEYRGEQGNRLILAPTFVGQSTGYWFNFYGNTASAVDNSWVNVSTENGRGSIWMR